MNGDKSSIWVVAGLLGLGLLGSRGCPGPDVPPGPGQMERLATLGILIVEDSTQRTPEEAEVLTDPAFRAWAAAAAARLRVVDVTAVRSDGQPSGLLGPWRALGAGGIPEGGLPALPALLLARSDGSVYRAVHLPDSWDAVKAWCEGQTLK